MVIFKCRDYLKDTVIIKDSNVIPSKHAYFSEINNLETIRNKKFIF